MYSTDLRNLASHVYSIFKSLRKSAVVLQVSHTTIARWLSNPVKKQYQRNKPKADIIVDVIRITIKANPFITVRAFIQIIKTTLKIDVSRELVRLVIKKLGYSQKKAKIFAQPKDLKQQTLNFVTKRNTFIYEGRNIVSLDETSFGRHGKPIFGYSLKGQPLICKKDTSKQGKATSVLAVVGQTGLIKKEHIQGAYNKVLFVRFLETLELPRNTVILLDNVRFHHSLIAKETAKRKGWELLYTPPYSPWFNPIEEVFSIVKRHYYKHWDIEASFKSLSSQHCYSFFNHALKMI